MQEHELAILLGPLIEAATQEQRSPFTAENIVDTFQKQNSHLIPWLCDEFNWTPDFAIDWLRIRIQRILNQETQMYGHSFN